MGESGIHVNVGKMVGHGESIVETRKGELIHFLSPSNAFIRFREHGFDC